MNRIRPAQYPFIPGSQKSGGSGILELVDSGITTMSTSTSDQAVAFYSPLPNTSDYILHVEGRNRPGANIGGEDISYYLSSVNSWTWRQLKNYGTYPVYWKLYKVPYGSVQHGRTSFTRSGSGAFTHDIAISTINDMTNCLTIPGTLGTSLLVSNQYSQVGIEGLRLTTATNLRAYLRKGNQNYDSGTTMYLGWQIWDPKG